MDGFSHITVKTSGHKAKFTWFHDIKMLKWVHIHVHLAKNSCWPGCEWTTLKVSVTSDLLQSTQGGKNQLGGCETSKRSNFWGGPRFRFLFFRDYFKSWVCPESAKTRQFSWVKKNFPSILHFTPIAIKGRKGFVDYIHDPFFFLNRTLMKSCSAIWGSKGMWR